MDIALGQSSGVYVGIGAEARLTRRRLIHAEGQSMLAVAVAHSHPTLHGRSGESGSTQGDLFLVYM